jgi:hypothetical protein
MTFDLESEIKKAVSEYFAQSASAEEAITKMPVHYLEASELLICIEGKLKSRYDNNYSPKVERLMGELIEALENAREPDEEYERKES